MPLQHLYEQDDDRLIWRVEPKYDLPFRGGPWLLVQGVGGKLSHDGDQTWAFDWAMPEGTPVTAARGGVVESAVMRGPQSRLPLESRLASDVRVRHDDGSMAVYAHLSVITVKRGQTVAAGDVLGASGNTGFSTRPHLHFHVEVDSRSVPVGFRGVGDPHGVPRAGCRYISNR